MMMDNRSEEPAAAIRIGVAQQKKNEHKSPPSPPKQQQPPGPPSMITVVDEDYVEPPFTSCNAIDSGDLAELLEKDAMKLDDDTTTASQEGAKLKKPEQSRHDHHRSSSDCIGIDIDGLIATMSSTKKKQQPITTPVTPETPERKHKIATAPASPVFSTTSSITDVSDLSTIQIAYRQYKRTMNISSISGGSGTLHDVIEGVEFCAFYCWRELFDDEASDYEEGNENNKEYVVMSKEKRKEERIKEMNNSFLGKMIQCGGVDDSYCNCGDYSKLSCHDDERDDCSGEILELAEL